jgi:hypothetical protein
MFLNLKMKANLNAKDASYIPESELERFGFCRWDPKSGLFSNEKEMHLGQL